MVQSNTTSKERDAFQQMRIHLDQTQRLAGEVEQRVADARSILRACIRQQETSNRLNLAEIITEAAKDSEFLTDRLRRMTLEIAPAPERYHIFENDLVRIHGIEVGYSEQILSVQLPVLIPHRKVQYTDYIYKPLHVALQQWCRRRLSGHLEIPRFCRATVCFVHCYDVSRPLARVRDNDNIEEKHVLDVISHFFLKSDSGIYVNTYHETRLHERDRTYIYVMPQEMFPEWILQNQDVQEHIEK